MRGKVAIGLPDVTQNRSDAAEYQALPEQSRQITDAASPKATNLALPRRSFARGSDYFYTSRLPGEPAAGVGDRHFHPVEPLAVRLTLAATL